jgi:hypothetical protein
MSSAPPGGIVGGMTRRLLLLVAACTLAFAAPARAELFGPPTPYPFLANPHAVTVGDLNADGDLDMVATSRDEQLAFVRLGGPGASFAQATWYGTLEQQPRRPVVVDIDDDGDEDLVVPSTASTLPAVTLLRGGDGGTFEVAGRFEVGPGATTAVALADFNGDGDEDMLAVRPGGGSVTVATGGVGSDFAMFNAQAVSGQPRDVAIADFNGDGDPDFAATGPANNTVSVRRGVADAGFLSGGTAQVGSTPGAIATGDFNGDGDPDLVVGNSGTGTVSVLLGSAGVGFAPHVDYPVTDPPYGIAVGDVNGDGDPDLAAALPDGDAVAILLGGAGGAFGAPTLFPATDTEDVALADVDQDGRLDLLATDGTGVSVRRNTTAPALEADRSNLQFGTQARDTVGTARTLTVFSTGDRPLHVRRVATAGAAGDDYLITGDRCTGEAVTPGGSCTLTVRFAPTAQGDREANLEIASDAPATTTIDLIGAGGALPAGPPGPVGPSGPPGPRGQAATRDRLVAVFAADRQRTAVRRPLRVRYVLTMDAPVTVELRRGERVLKRLDRTGTLGRNTITLRAPRKRGRYTLVLTAAAGGQSATDRATLSVARR